MNDEPIKVPKKRKKRVSKKPSGLKMVVSRTYSEGAKINIGNYQSRDFFASATRMMEIPLPTTHEEQEEVSALLISIVKQEVKAALQAETDDASGTKPMENTYVKVDDPPSVPNAFSQETVRVYPGKKYVPREDDDDIDLN